MPMPREYVAEDYRVSSAGDSNTVTITLPNGSEKVVHCALHREEQLAQFPESQNFIMYSRRPVHERFDPSNSSLTIFYQSILL